MFDFLSPVVSFFNSFFVNLTSSFSSVDFLDFSLSRLFVGGFLAIVFFKILRREE